MSRGDDQEPEVIEVRIWNDTVANLTLMALGSSAPEILLSVIEIIGNGFEAGKLGPGTIVGSAAFNLMAISSVCIMAIPGTETRKIKGHTLNSDPPSHLKSLLLFFFFFKLISNFINLTDTFNNFINLTDYYDN